MSSLKTFTITIPDEVQFIIDTFQKNNFDAELVGGCVRDILRGLEPQDWDVAVNAKPEEIGNLFLRSFSNNKFGTVKVLIPKKKSDISGDSEEQKKEFMEIEVTPFRTEEKYSDKRHPDEIKWAKTIEEDLKRRDFTINAMALKVQSSKLKVQNSKFKIIDPFNGQEDLKNKIIRAVGNPEERFNEDALRLIRAIRFAVSLGPKIWQIEEKTSEAIRKNAHLLQLISMERVRDELVKIIDSVNGGRGVEILRRYQLLQHLIPELEEGFGVEQNKHHIYQVYQHNLLSLNYGCQRKFSKLVKLAALLHDIAKPRTKQGEGSESTFYNHEVVGAEMAYQILNRLKFSKKEIEKIVKLVRYHLFYYNVGEVGESSVRRLLRKVGWEDISGLLEVRQADRIGSGVPKAEPYKLRHLKYLFEKVSQDPISPKMLKVAGYDVMRILNIPPGPRVGQILSYLLAEVLIDPKKNDRVFLENEIISLKETTDQELKNLTQKSQEEIEKIETKRDEMTKSKYWIT